LLLFVFDVVIVYRVESVNPVALAVAVLRFFCYVNAAESTENIKQAKRQFSWERFVEVVEQVVKLQKEVRSQESEVRMKQRSPGSAGILPACAGSTIGLGRETSRQDACAPKENRVVPSDSDF